MTMMGDEYEYTKEKVLAMNISYYMIFTICWDDF